MNLFLIHSYLHTIPYFPHSLLSSLFKTFIIILYHIPLSLLNSYIIYYSHSSIILSLFYPSLFINTLTILCYPKIYYSFTHHETTFYNTSYILYSIFFLSFLYYLIPLISFIYIFSLILQN
jgi:hypothetical protein